MSKFDSKKMMPRYSFIAILLSFLAAMVMTKMVYTMTAKRDFWMQVADRVKIDSLETPPVRGNILSSDGQLMASSLPQYKLYLDFRATYSPNSRPTSSASISWKVWRRTRPTGPYGSDASTTALTRR